MISSRIVQILFESILISALCFVSQPVCATGQIQAIQGIPSEVDFSRPLRQWDGFGFNYVETAHTYDYEAYPQDYGGFSLLDEQEKRQIIDLVFGEEGLKVALLKMFLDPLHQVEPDGPYNHELSTKNMLEFAMKGLETTRRRGSDLTIITTLYGPPAWATLQKFAHARDLDPEMKGTLANYMIDWLRFLIKEKKLPVKYLSLHNEGEDWSRWPWDGQGEGLFDYNFYWPHEQVNDFLEFMPDLLHEAGLEDVQLTNGEPSNWTRFYGWGCAAALYDDKAALANLGLITSHGFYAELALHRWYGNHNSVGVDLLHEARPELNAWVTSTGWGNMDAFFVREIYGNLYQTKVNGLIPWAGIQRPSQWKGRDPNAGCAIRVNEDGSYEIRKGYYFYKQLTRAGQPGMAVAHTWAMDTQTPVIGFTSNGTSHPDAIVIINWDKKWNKILAMKIRGTKAVKFHGYRTDAGGENYQDIGLVAPENGLLIYEAPIGSVTTLFGIEE
jgi:hypothetical protein